MGRNGPCQLSVKQDELDEILSANSADTHEFYIILKAQSI